MVHSSTLSLSPIMLWWMQFSHPLSRNCTHSENDPSQAPCNVLLIYLLQSHSSHLFLCLDQLAGEAGYEGFPPFLRHFCMVLSNFGCRCSHHGHCQTFRLKLSIVISDSLLLPFINNVGHYEQPIPSTTVETPFRTAEKIGSLKNAS